MALVRGFFGELQAATRDLTCVRKRLAQRRTLSRAGVRFTTLPTIPSTCLSLGLIAFHLQPLIDRLLKTRRAKEGSLTWHRDSLSSASSVPPTPGTAVPPSSLQRRSGAQPLPGSSFQVPPGFSDALSLVSEKKIEAEARPYLSFCWNSGAFARDFLLE